MRLISSDYECLGSEDIFVKPKTEITKERAGAYQVADLICEALDKLPKNEQEAKIKKIRAIDVIDRRS
jgi:hypothetical protein